MDIDNWTDELIEWAKPGVEAKAIRDAEQHLQSRIADIPWVAQLVSNLSTADDTSSDTTGGA